MHPIYVRYCTVTYHDTQFSTVTTHCFIPIVAPTTPTDSMCLHWSNKAIGRAATKEANTALLIVWYCMSYCIVGNFRGVQFSQMDDLLTFHGLPYVGDVISGLKFRNTTWHHHGEQVEKERTTFSQFEKRLFTQLLEATAHTEEN